ncbi:hypothetical protein Daura_51435 [Dactylosporangium aurantiacum]|uniref:Uncharacterized protein n=1 Tax=Dactylosporangium aurantiacum TaxID=35754 RepID=A0A9Q9IIU6_9ACTN|nr:hypothetical protein [Dactylosporangium aurantiacum]MDG6101256.1 hypothetical protein [Dactylosporangium aurantiacum]UWZ54727.1 hypothetical protein Daura_51435 [Dactylosporangium aurantiacum]
MALSLQDRARNRTVLTRHALRRLAYVETQPDEDAGSRAASRLTSLLVALPRIERVMTDTSGPIAAAGPGGAR